VTHFVSILDRIDVIKKRSIFTFLISAAVTASLKPVRSLSPPTHQFSVPPVAHLRDNDSPLAIISLLDEHVALHFLHILFPI
jgi:hypothetical protein